MKATPNAIEAQRIINKNDIVIGLGETKQKAIFNAVEVGKATVPQQEKTDLKQKEESARKEGLSKEQEYEELDRLEREFEVIDKIHKDYKSRITKKKNRISDLKSFMRLLLKDYLGENKEGDNE